MNTNNIPDTFTLEEIAYMEKNFVEREKVGALIVAAEKIDSFITKYGIYDSRGNSMGSDIADDLNALRSALEQLKGEGK